MGISLSHDLESAFESKCSVGSQGVDFILKSTVSPMAKLSLANQRFDKLTSAHSMADKRP